MFDFTKTLELIKGGLLQPQATWDRFLGENPDLKTTLIQLTGPLIVANVLLSVIFSRLVGGFYAYGMGGGWFMAIIMGLIMAVIGFAIATVVINALAGAFGGKPDLNRAFAALSLASIPGYLASIVGALIPFLGFLIILAGAIMSLVFLWRILPQALAIPNEKRALHYIVSLVSIFIVNMIMVTILGIGSGTRQFGSAEFGDIGDGASGGMFSGIMRQAELQDAADRDRYDPPGSGKVSEDQVKALLRVAEKVETLQQRESDKLKKMAEEMENKEQPSFGDIAKVYQSTGSMMGLANAEMEVVKTGGGNWAEHQWVKEQLRIAIVQQDGSDAIEHNHRLYQKYQDELDKIID
ncbi:MAG: YIP1 family protein [Gammaproteobacteria bacterium]|nr:YIP1 family protein [Gammaproteobacteria bacterium]